MNDMIAWRLLATLASTMAAVAIAHDWDRLVAMDADFHRQLQALQTQPPGKLSIAEAQEKTRLLTAILEHQHTVRDQVEPWLDHVQPLLAALSPRPAAVDSTGG